MTNVPRFTRKGARGKIDGKNRQYSIPEKEIIMRKTTAKIAALLLSAALLLPALPAAFASEAMGTELTRTETGLAPDTTLTTTRMWSASSNDLRTEHYTTFAPGSGVTPQVTYGNSVIAKSTLSSLASGLTAKGLRVIGGINGGFYNVTAGTPIGLVIKDGELCSSASYQYAVGFRADGTVLVGQPVTKITAAFHGETLPVSGGLNKTRTTSGGIYLISDIYASNTQNTSDGVDVILTPENGARPMLGTSIRCTVDQVRGSKEDRSLPKGKLILTMNAGGDAETLAKLRSLLEGEEVVLDFTSSDPAWNDVVTGIGSSYRLMSGGAVLTGLPTGTAPRTAIGVKPDGSVVLYTMDGRQSGYSVGATYTQVAKRLSELGCTEAVALDGGGSTTMGATLPGSSTFSLVNRPSDGAQRSISNGVFLSFGVTQPTGVLHHFGVGPGGTVLLSGAQLSMTAAAVDSAYYGMNYGGTLTYGVKGSGSINSAGLYTAGRAGTDTVTVTGGNVTGSTTVVVVDTPDQITVQREGTTAALSVVSTVAGESVNLSAAAKWKNIDVVADDRCFTWSVDPTVGTITADGVFTASTLRASGNLTVTAGSKSYTIPVTVRGVPYTDVPLNAWYYEAVQDVYERFLMNGVSDTLFAPDSTMNRAMLCTVLWRVAGEPNAVTNGNLPLKNFSDVPEGAYYAKAVAWAAQQGIVNGLTADTFGPDAPVTRQQIAALLCRFAQSLGRDMTIPDGAPALDDFSDRSTVASWAEESMTWAVGKGLVNGSGGQLLPGGNATRCQVAAILQRFLLVCSK